MTYPNCGRPVVDTLQTTIMQLYPIGFAVNSCCGRWKVAESQRQQSLNYPAILPRIILQIKDLPSVSIPTKASFNLCQTMSRPTRKPLCFKGCAVACCVCTVSHGRGLSTRLRRLRLLSEPVVLDTSYIKTCTCAVRKHDLEITPI